jgi:hypothetical protein
MEHTIESTFVVAEGPGNSLITHIHLFANSEGDREIIRTLYTQRELQSMKGNGSTGIIKIFHPAATEETTFGQGFTIQDTQH